MTGKKQVDLDSLRLGDRDFDRMMRKALQIAPPPEDKVKGSRKSKKAGKRKAKN